MTPLTPREKEVTTKMAKALLEVANGLANVNNVEEFKTWADGFEEGPGPLTPEEEEVLDKLDEKAN